MVYKNSNNAWNNQIYKNLLRGLMRMFSFHRLGLGLMNCAVRVLNGSINRIQFDWLITRIHQIMPFSGRHKHRIIRLYFLYKIEFILCITHQDTSLSLFDTEKLVNIGMQFQTYIAADRNRHQRYLQICTRPQGGTEIFRTISGAFSGVLSRDASPEFFCPQDAVTKRVTANSPMRKKCLSVFIIQ